MNEIVSFCNAFTLVILGTFNNNEAQKTEKERTIRSWAAKEILLQLTFRGYLNMEFISFKLNNI